MNLDSELLHHYRKRPKKQPEFASFICGECFQSVRSKAEDLPEAARTHQMVCTKRVRP